MRNTVYVVIPNWNGAEDLREAIVSLFDQSLKDFTLLVVENGSTDHSRSVIEELQAKDKRLAAIYNPENLGFAGGVNVGIREAMKNGADFVALFNNDAKADKHWLKHLAAELQENPKVGIATCKFLNTDGTTFDSTGDQLSVWGLPYPRGRGEPASNAYDKQRFVFGASGGASLYRVSMLEKIGLFDEDFFAYYEDVDLSFRAQLAGWKVVFAPKAVAYHQIGATSGKIRGFTTYQTFKNLPWLLVKNVPRGLLWRFWWRFTLAYDLFFLSATLRGHFWFALKGNSASLWLLPKKLGERRGIQKQKTVSAGYIDSMLMHDLPPNQTKLRKIRKIYWKLTFRKSS